MSKPVISQLRAFLDALNDFDRKVTVGSDSQRSLLLRVTVSTNVERMKRRGIRGKAPIPVAGALVSAEGGLSRASDFDGEMEIDLVYRVGAGESLELEALLADMIFASSGLSGALSEGE